MDTLKSAASDNLVWPEAAFKNMLAIADSGSAMVKDGNRIKLPDEVRTMSAWKIAAFRVDPSAPGTSPDIIVKFGSTPQIRLILQPVTITPSGVKIHDIALHVLYSYTSKDNPTEAGSFPRAEPDTGKFREIVNGLVRLRKLCEDAGVTTLGVPLGVHPGLKQPDKLPDLLPQLRAFLSDHLSDSKLTAMAIMGLPNNFEPWIFVAMPRQADGSFGASPSPGLADPTKTAIMLTFQDSPNVSPLPVTNNRNPTTGAMFVSPSLRRGIATTVLFDEGVILDAPATIGIDATGQLITDAEIKNRDIPDIISHPSLSHFFNTDCISCHTATTRQRILKIKVGNFAFNPTAGISGISPDVLPDSKWNVRNLGWFHSDLVGPAIVATATDRTANETATAVEFINRNYLKQESK